MKYGIYFAYYEGLKRSHYMEIKKYGKTDESLLFDLLVDEEMNGSITMGQMLVTSTLKRSNRV